MCYGLQSGVSVFTINTSCGFISLTCLHLVQPSPQGNNKSHVELCEVFTVFSFTFLTGSFGSQHVTVVLIVTFIKMLRKHHNMLTEMSTSVLDIGGNIAILVFLKLPRSVAFTKYGL